MVYRLFSPYHYVIHICLHISFNEVLEHLTHQPRVGCSYVLQERRHPLITEGINLNCEGYLFFILKVHMYLVITQICIEKTHDVIPNYCIDKLINAWERMTILSTYSIEKTHDSPQDVLMSLMSLNELTCVWITSFFPLKTSSSSVTLVFYTD